MHSNVSSVTFIKTKKSVFRGYPLEKIDAVIKNP